MDHISHNPGFAGRTLARAAADRIQHDHWSLFRQLRVPVHEVAQALGLDIEERRELRQRAHLEITTIGTRRRYKIVIRSGLDTNVRRFAVAHEIGHVALCEEYPRYAATWESDKQEQFANSFAGELLLTPQGRTLVNNDFPYISDPVELLKMATEVGLTPHALLTTAEESLHFPDFEKIWLRVKFTVNAVTQSEPRLRIVSAHYDRRRYYIATNQSLMSFAGNDNWLQSAPIGETFRHLTAISVNLKRPEGSTPRFVPTQLDAQLSAVRLQPNLLDQRSYYILVANIAETAEPTPAPQMQ